MWKSNIVYTTKLLYKVFTVQYLCLWHYSITNWENLRPYFQDLYILHTVLSYRNLL